MTAQIFTSSTPEITPYAAVISPTGLPSPVLTDDPNVPRDMLALTAALDDSIVPTFPTTAARDAARTAGATFTLCYIADVLYRWRAGVWQVMVTDVHPATILGPATVSSVTLGAAGGTLGIAAAITVTAVPYPRIIRIELTCTLASATTWVAFSIRNGGTILATARAATPQQTVRCMWTETLIAGAARAYDAVMTSTAAAVCYGTTPNPGIADFVGIAHTYAQ